MNIHNIITALLVSVDSFFIGIYLGTQKNIKFRHFVIIAAIVFIVCMAANTAARLLSRHITFDFGRIAGALFLVLGIKNLLSVPDNKNRELTALKLSLFGMLMATDGGIAAFSIALESTKSVLIPLIISATHFIFAYIGSCITRLTKRIPKSQNLVSGLCLVILGGLKIIGIL